MCSMLTELNGWGLQRLKPGGNVTTSEGPAPEGVSSLYLRPQKWGLFSSVTFNSYRQCLAYLKIYGGIGTVPYRAAYGVWVNWLIRPDVSSINLTLPMAECG
jgi:hypothetical protein